MQRGDVLEGRFELEEHAGAGGMGQVFRGRDVHSGEPVAVKMLLEDAGSHEPRFVLETRALAELSHPNIVRYVAHGTAATGEPYLVMEWLDGEDLSRRLRRDALSVDESIEVASRVAEALGAAHERGIVHRDLKPSNIFLVGGRIERIKLVDFGIARWGGGTRITRTGAIVGTPGYMAPEQVQSSRAIDPRADVFSLGCVLFECLTGSPAFEAEHPVALLAKVVFAEPPRLCEARPDAPPALEELLSAMLAKDPDQRPGGGAAVAEALAALDRRSGPRGVSLSPVALTSAERRTLSVVLIGSGREGPRDDERTQERSLAKTLDERAADLADAWRRGAAEWGGHLSRLGDGSAAVTIGGAGLATDQAAQAARCALWLHRHAGGRPVALSSGRADGMGRSATGEAIDRAARMLVSRLGEGGEAGIAMDSVAIDEMTARLLNGRFDVREGGGGLVLHGEREMAEGARLLLRKPTACVGRDRELSTLAQLFAACIDEPLAQAALVTAPAGAGKSRVAQELLIRLRQRGEPIAVWTARGDSLRAGSALGLLGQALRGACGIRGDEPLPERRYKLSSRVAQCIEGVERRRVTELLGEILGVPFPDDDSVLLRTARRNPQILTEEMRRAWVDFLRAECAAQPVLLVLEDLHWGDGATVRLLDAALRDLPDRSWMVLALARPEVHELFPKLWVERCIQEIKLPPLGKKASERLVRQVLGSEIGADTAERIVAQADGNAFYLEELIRAVAENRGEELPETVLAMVQSRLGALADEDRRVLRAAAVFGEAFWPGGVAALLGGGARAAGVQARLQGLVEREVLVKRPESRFSGEAELAFRHPLLREGAYSMLTGDDCTVGHKLAGEWLERMGESDARLLAEHFDRGGEAARAATHYLRAAEHALEGGDPVAMIRLAERGIALGQELELIAGLHALAADARCRIGDLPGAVRSADEALRHARPGSQAEGRALMWGFIVASFAGNADLLREPLERLLRTEPEPDAAAPVAAAFYAAVTWLALTGQRDQAELYLQRLIEVTAHVTGRDPLTLAWVETSRALLAGILERDHWGAAEHARRARRQFELAGASRLHTVTGFMVGVSYWSLGLFERADEEFDRALVVPPATPIETAMIDMYRSMMRIDQWRLGEASVLAARALHAAQLLGDQRICLHSRLCLIGAQLYQGAIESAESELLAMSEVAATQIHLSPFHLTLLASSRLAQGRAADAAEIAERACWQWRASGMPHVPQTAMLLLVRAEALHALGDHNAARGAIREARDDLQGLAAKIPDLEVRRGFLANFAEHRRTLELAREWLGEDPDDGIAASIKAIAPE